MNRGWRNRGTTLVEMLVALAISSLLMGGFVSVYWSGSYIFAEQAAYAEAQYSARSSVQMMAVDIRRASTVAILDNGAQLSLVSASGELVRYYRYNYQLFREGITGRGTARVPIAENISGLQFNGIASLVIFNIEATVGGQSYQLSTCANSRLADQSR
ncbi:MAG: prepilin-type N-terminal cleavage/methylation domain-containing protein [Firmicutes bacterium]|nr:prepilin-type N-terminal cleavage/methylation domain-containing protein [Bacillota bacterium]